MLFSRQPQMVIFQERPKYAFNKRPGIKVEKNLMQYQRDITFKKRTNVRWKEQFFVIKKNVSNDTKPSFTWRKKVSTTKITGFYQKGHLITLLQEKMLPQVRSCCKTIRLPLETNTFFAQKKNPPLLRKKWYLLLQQRMSNKLLN